MSKTKKPLVAVIMGSISDWVIMKEACMILDHFKVPYYKEVISAHRTPDDMRDFAVNAKKNGFKIIIAGAGGAAHLPGMTASYTTLPVIGVPIQTKALSGIDSLYSIVQMPKGIPVATVAIGNAENAGLLAIQMLAVNDATLSKTLDKFRNDQKKKVVLSRKDIN